MILVIDLCKEQLNKHEFVSPIIDIIVSMGLKYQATHYFDLKEDMLKAEKIILCPTALKDHGYIENLDRFRWIDSFEKPILGICAGFQVIGAVLGENIIKSKEIGMIDIHLKKQNKLIKEDIRAYSIHSRALEITKMDILAKSENCVHAAMKGNIYGVLFHPEVRNKEIIRRFLSD